MAFDRRHTAVSGDRGYRRDGSPSAAPAVPGAWVHPPRWAAALPGIGGFRITTKPQRSRCSTSRLATIVAMISAKVVHALSPAVAQRERQRVGDVFGLGRQQGLVGRHACE